MKVIKSVDADSTWCNQIGRQCEFDANLDADVKTQVSCKLVETERKARKEMSHHPFTGQFTEPEMTKVMNG